MVGPIGLGGGALFYLPRLFRPTPVSWRHQRAVLRQASHCRQQGQVLAS
jgi:hypothetical protein